ncbi:acyltransferase [Fluviicola sp.]|jgi:peptidoglycan/LPS O-acetylase OafA/YrhL|uniref:acyltransferase family protein n=1 Tax=Fluviicola sp. TaxID=1917219 RepID=UPI0028242203|nr:acyltransferase [Fluviicola sp.]MDR0801735.1 acyltransferase [Fluviicola sp.]
MFGNLIRTLNNTGRQINIDFLRGCAVLSVVLFHFNGTLPYGYLGVDLFFVISGYLVGGALMKDFLLDKKISFFGFFLKRGFKIWPSYYIFLVIGFLLSNLLFSGEFEEQRLRFSELPRYVFWYRNFVGGPFHFAFDHVWSLCIEEHFYLLFPCLILILREFKTNGKVLVFSLVLTIILSFVCKWIMLTMTNSRDTYAMTFNRLDTFSWGILAAYLQFRGKDLASKKEIRSVLLLVGIAGIALTVYVNESGFVPYFKELIMHSILPVFMFCIIWSTLLMKNSGWIIPFRVIGYYSYNWYLWNPIVAVLCMQYLGKGLWSFVIYLLVSALMAVIFTRFVEESFLKLRNRFFKR